VLVCDKLIYLVYHTHAFNKHPFQTPFIFNIFLNLTKDGNSSFIKSGKGVCLGGNSKKEMVMEKKKKKKKKGRELGV